MFFCIFFIKNKSLKSFAFAFDLRLKRELNSLFCFFARLVLAFVNEIHNKIKTYYKLNWWVISFALMPATYPKIMSKMNLRLIDFAVCALMFFIRFIGHDKPKHISIVASSACVIFVILYLSFLISWYIIRLTTHYV